MHVLEEPSGINDGYQRHPPELEEIDFLPVTTRYPVSRIRNADEGHLFRAPVPAKLPGPVRSDGDHFGGPAGEFGVVIPKARQLRAAVWSEEASEKSENDCPAPVV